MLTTLFILIIAVVIYAILTYNKLQRSGQKVKSYHANILTMLQKRADTINKLMDIAREYGNHEKLVHISHSNNIKDLFSSSENARITLNAVAMQFPQLNANTSYQKLMHSLEEVETQIQRKRELYNKVVETYNSQRIVFPANLIAGQLGFKEAPYFDNDNFEAVKDFKTDDGELLKGMLTKVTAQASEMTKKSLIKSKETLAAAAEELKTVGKDFGSDKEGGKEKSVSNDEKAGE